MFGKLLLQRLNKQHLTTVRKYSCNNFEDPFFTIYKYNIKGFALFGYFCGMCSEFPVSYQPSLLDRTIHGIFGGICGLMFGIVSPIAIPSFTIAFGVNCYYESKKH